MVPKSGHRFSDKTMRKKSITRSLFAVTLALVAAFAATPSDAREVVQFVGSYRPGAIVIITQRRELYRVLGGGRAVLYPVGVGRAGMAWHGHAYVAAKHLRPAWTPNPASNVTIPGGSPRNPMGAAALGLDRGNYAIHGTNDPSSVGGFVSHGCIRMLNEDVMELYRSVPIGAEVYVLR